MNPSPEHDDGRLVVGTANGGDAAWIILQGEADTANLETFEAALAGTEIDGQKLVGIDVSDLEFIDVPALRRLTAFAMQVRESGHQVTTRGARPVVHEVARLLDVRETLGLP